MNREYLINTSRLLKNLTTSINADHLLSTTDQLGHKVHKIESIIGRSLYSIKMRSEIANLEDQLNYRLYINRGLQSGIGTRKPIQSRHQCMPSGEVGYTSAVEPIAAVP